MTLPCLLRMRNGKLEKALGLRQSRDESSKGTDCVMSPGNYPDPLRFWLICRIFGMHDENQK